MLARLEAKKELSRAAEASAQSLRGGLSSAHCTCSLTGEASSQAGGGQRALQLQLLADAPPGLRACSCCSARPPGEEKEPYLGLRVAKRMRDTRDARAAPRHIRQGSREMYRVVLSRREAARDC